MVPDEHGHKTLTGGRKPAQPLAQEDIVRQLDAAILEHLDWMLRWNRSAVCKVKPPSDITSDHAHFLCGFGNWYDLHQQDPLVAQPAFEALALAHRDLHQNAAWLGQRAWKDAKIPVEEYDLLIEKVTRFTDLARKLLKAFQKVTSDLDPLTGTQTRQTMTKELMRERERSLRGGKPCVVAMGDLDHFKQVNDTHGHQAGDMVLRLVAAAFLEALRPYDRLYRFGGEEFLFCLPDATPEAARQALDRLRRRVEELHIPTGGGRVIHITCSFGIASLSGDIPVKTTMQRADKALYAAKEAGRNRVTIWTPEIGLG
jgi:diguanylate cyclase (GGDEF)-like protein